MWISIQHRFGPRMMEWFMAGHMILFGYVMLLPSETFNQPAFHSFRDLVPSENFMGWGMLLVGCLRIVGLVINGARKTVTPQIRQVSAAIGCIIWSGISYGFASSDVVSTWIAIYPLFAIGELVNINRAARDQGEARNGPTG
ncbi:hypothetical protein LAV84_04950 [Rhizobium sp. VS19-DR104.2]|uniref:hypothetical protein n=1 Tax=unclassified Rhizobium TaxID=2613769 RepID=UPI001CC75A4C|nr:MULTISPECIES: hypothetical protein [unclassified Rhizobium]MBZ5757969.1 hypothetical protein [Rhizobium sp. VS19-DR96]MBZ5772744.1 hypothetical protein [Rhizobium sp. VS19-DRK62.2]MBZ5782569.1 hypothetical protein [Rhizobium sp. VS19-DR121]MBZ5800017.1 hypothetical protein [Rhizobium sp. VS19-DR181]MBZ5829053.1 hypothetical protein [Rhizobium sp. VS19-DR104.2]